MCDKNIYVSAIQSSVGFMLINREIISTTIATDSQQMSHEMELPNTSAKFIENDFIFYLAAE